MTFGQRLRVLRKAHQLTQRDLAAAVGVDFTYISKIENGKTPRLPSEALIRRLAVILETDPGELLDSAGKLDLRQLQRIAKDEPQAGVLLRRIQSGQLTRNQWHQIGKILEQGDGR